jgi:hypothetical protein
MIGLRAAGLSPDEPPYSLVRRAAPHSRAQPRTGGHDASMRHFVADCAMIGLQAAGLSPNALAGRVDAIESTASGAHAPTCHCQGLCHESCHSCP